MNEKQNDETRIREEKNRAAQEVIFNRPSECTPPQDSTMRRRLFFLLAWGFSSLVLGVISYSLFKSLDKWYFTVLSIAIGIAAGFLLALGICAVMNIFMPSIFFKNRENQNNYDWMDVDWPYHPDV